MGTLRRQAETLIVDHGSPTLYSVRLEPEGLRCLTLSGMTWALFVAYNRNHLSGPNNKQLRAVISDIAGGMDLIVGAIADDRMNYVLKQFFSGNITDHVLLHCMRGMNLGTQYVALTQKACDQIFITDEHKLRADEVSRIRNQANKIYQDGMELVRQTRRRYRNDGEYFDEILEILAQELEGGQHGIGPDFDGHK